MKFTKVTTVARELVSFLIFISEVIIDVIIASSCTWSVKTAVFRSSVSLHAVRVARHADRTFESTNRNCFSSPPNLRLDVQAFARLFAPIDLHSARPNHMACKSVFSSMRTHVSKQILMHCEHSFRFSRFEILGTQSWCGANNC